MDDVPIRQISIWDQLDEEQKRNVVEALARVITKMMVAKQQSGGQR
jgi:phenylpyruvate tautomerase PptA (4-oxalocrotonate tautomerase family)